MARLATIRRNDVTFITACRSALLYFQVPKVVTKKRQNAVVRALIGSFNAARSKTAPAKLVHHLLGPDGKQQSVSGVVRRMEKCLLPVIREESVAGATLSDGHPHPRPEGLVSDEASITWSAFKTELLHSGVIRAGEDSSELLQLFASAAGDKGDAANPSLCWKNLKVSARNAVCLLTGKGAEEQCHSADCLAGSTVLCLRCVPLGTAWVDTAVLMGAVRVFGRRV